MPSKMKTYNGPTDLRTDGGTVPRMKVLRRTLKSYSTVTCRKKQAGREVQNPVSKSPRVAMCHCVDKLMSENTAASRADLKSPT